MRRTRFITLAVISFITISATTIFTPGAWLNRLFSMMLCSVISVNTLVCPANIALSTQRTLAASPPVTETSLPTGSSMELAQRSTQKGEFCNVQDSSGKWWLLIAKDISSDPCGTLLTQHCQGNSCQIVSNGTYLLYGQNQASVTCQGYNNTFVGVGAQPLGQAFTNSTSPLRSSCTFQVIPAFPSSLNIALFRNTTPTPSLVSKPAANIPLSQPGTNVSGNSDNISLSTSEDSISINPPNLSRQPRQQNIQPTTKVSADSTIDSDSLDGIWIYSVYGSPSLDGLFLKTPIEITQNGDETEVSLCQGRCEKFSRSLQTNYANRVPQDQSLIAEYGNIIVETVESTDGQTIWGEIRDRSTGNSIYFTLEQTISLISGLSYEEKPSKFEEISLNLFDQVKQNKQSKSFSSNPISSGLKRLVQTALPTSDVSSVNRAVEPITEIQPIDNNSVKNSIRANARKLVEQAQQNIGRSIDCIGRSQEFRYASLKVKSLYAFGLCDFRRLPSAERNLLRSSVNSRVLGKLALGGLRIGLRVAGRLALPLLLLDLGLTAYEFCTNNPGVCERIANDIAQGVNDLTKRSLRQGRSYGDPHLITFDGYRYSFQTVGEFVLVQTKDGGFQVQVRQGAVPGRQLSLNTGVAMQVGNSRVAVYSKDFPDGNANTPVWVDGRPVNLEGSLELSGGGSIQGGNGNYLVQWQTGEQVGISKLSVAGMEFMNVTPAVPDQAGRYVGLLGDLDDNPENDLQKRDGQVILTKDNSTYGILKQALGNLGAIPLPLSQIETAFFEQLYREFGDSWRISQAESLFAYGPGQSTESFTNRGFPSSFSTLGSLLPPQLRQAEEICRQAGVPGDLLEGCIFDVGNTGEGGFAQAALNTVLDEVKNRVEAEIRNRIPIPVPIPLPF